MEALTTAVTNITTVATNVLTFIEGEPLFMIFLAAPLLGVGIGLVKRLAHR